MGTQVKLACCLGCGQGSALTLRDGRLVLFAFSSLLSPCLHVRSEVFSWVQSIASARMLMFECFAHTHIHTHISLNGQKYVCPGAPTPPAPFPSPHTRTGMCAHWSLGTSHNILSRRVHGFLLTQAWVRCVRACRELSWHHARWSRGTPHIWGHRPHRSPHVNHSLLAFHGTRSCSTIEPPSR